jgi:hypothetical protein
LFLFLFLFFFLLLLLMLLLLFLHSLQQIVDLDEKNQILTSNIWLNLDWVDHSLMWNASEYGGVKVGNCLKVHINMKTVAKRQNKG